MTEPGTLRGSLMVRMRRRRIYGVNMEARGSNGLDSSYAVCQTVRRRRVGALKKRAGGFFRAALIGFNR